MTGTKAQHSVVIDFATPRRHSEMSATGVYENEQERADTLKHIRSYLIKIRSKIRHQDQSDGKDEFLTRIKSLDDCRDWYEDRFHIRRVPRVHGVPDFIHWVENNWGIEAPAIFRELDQLLRKERAKGHDADARMYTSIQFEYLKWADHEFDLPN